MELYWYPIPFRCILTHMAVKHDLYMYFDCVNEKTQW